MTVHLHWVQSWVSLGVSFGLASHSPTRPQGALRGLSLTALSLALADMSIFGHCPAHDEFYLVVCNHCSQVVKPQAFQKHCGKPIECPG